MFIGLGRTRHIGLTLVAVVVGGALASPESLVAGSVHGAAVADFAASGAALRQTGGAPNMFTVTTADDDGPGSLRQTLFDAGSTPGVDLIAFAIPGPAPHVIALRTALPALLDQMTIDATTEPGFVGAPVVQIDASAVPNKAGLVVAVDGAVVRGLSITGAAGSGVSLFNANGCVIEGNYIGVDPSGRTAEPNQFGGVSITSSTGNTIGGTTAAARNVISGNGKSGVALDSGSSGNTIVGNYIGVDASGNAPLPNTGNGVYVDGSPGVVVVGNTIAGNQALGVGLFNGASGARIQNNRIGIGVGDAAIGNDYDGVYMQDSDDVLVGGDGEGEDNVIAFNGASGVLVYSGTRDSIRRNSIYSNGWIGIDIDKPGISKNDPGDADTGANGLLNYPVLAWVTASAGGATVRGRYDGAPGLTVHIEFFSNPECDPYGYGEGQTYIGALDVVTDASGTAQFEAHLPVEVVAGAAVTATATDPEGDTSEFCECTRARLAWAAPTTPGGPPSQLVITPVAMGRSDQPTSPRADVTGYNVYRSTTMPVATVSGNLFTSVPPTMTSVDVPSSSGGFFTVTATYGDGSESGPSNDAGMPQAPSVSSIALKGASKLVITGTNFSAETGVFVDGIPFVAAAKVKRGTRVMQKGSLLTGETVRHYLGSRTPGPDGHRQVLVGVRNNLGAVGTFLLAE